MEGRGVELTHDPDRVTGHRDLLHEGSLTAGTGDDESPIRKALGRDLTGAQECLDDQVDARVGIQSAAREHDLAWRTPAPEQDARRPEDEAVERNPGSEASRGDPEVVTVSG